MNINQVLNGLPQHLKERTRVVQVGPAEVGGRFVLYWMCTAIRLDENPALDVAKLLASNLKLPLLVYQGLSERYEYASDRHHTFILQGARDVQAAFSEDGIAYAFHLERPNSDGRHLKDLASCAAVVVAEEMPTGAQPIFLRALARRTGTAILSVDTACVLPMQMVGRAYERAFQFRSKTKPLFAERVSRAWPEITATPSPFDVAQLPFEPLDLQSANLANLVSQCEIDHLVGPVLDTQGGSVAGYRRWKAFLDGGLRAYAKKRNDALLDGVSRMSAYLHYGMVSPMRVAREAADQKHAGAEKFLDELLIWRELAYGFCFYRQDHGSWSSLPDWAQSTLRNHASDSKPRLYAWETLARGETHDAMWNAAQKSLLIHGELHNNVRMTWGKAVLNWRRTPEDALQTVIDLNHRYALDGRDPSSYGGILWCFGQFDRPFTPERKIFGTVRGRPTGIHRQRLDISRYAAKTSVSRLASVPKIAVVGAGISGAIAARTLADHGLQVTLFEKSRGAGGRMATRRTAFGEFDHGAQYFTARDARFRRYVDSWIEHGFVGKWEGKIVVFDQAGSYYASSSDGRFVGMPGMNAIAKHLVQGLDLRSETKVEAVEREGSSLELLDADGSVLGNFDKVIVTAPAPQTAKLVRQFSDLASQVESVSLNPCWAVLVRLASQLPADWAGAFVNEGPLRWIARNGSKPGRDSDQENIVLHASSEWSSNQLKRNNSEITEQLLVALWHTLSIEPQQIVAAEAHRWRYSIPVEATGSRCLSNAEGDVLACGDWAGGPRVEGAFLSGCAAAGRLLGGLELPAKAPGLQNRS